MNIQKIVDEYSVDYCLLLEAAYGPNLMSEGGTEAIDHLFSGIDLQGKKVLDIGCGLGGLVFHIAKTYGAIATGLEINRPMLDEAIKRIPNHLAEQVTFSYYTGKGQLPFADESFDIICSKGVLVHLDDKKPLLEEVMRVLKPEGKLLINDWLSLTADKLGESLQKMCEAEDLTLFPQTLENYIQLLAEVGFIDIQSRNDSALHLQYHDDILQHLQNTKHEFIQKFNEQLFDEHYHGYTFIKEALQNKELIITTLSAEKPNG